MSFTLVLELIILMTLFSIMLKTMDLNK